MESGRMILYEGAFVVHLADDADLTFARTVPGITIEEHVVRVGFDPRFPGRVEEVPGAIELHSKNIPFFWGYKYLKKIEAANGTPIYTNPRFYLAQPHQE